MGEESKNALSHMNHNKDDPHLSGQLTGGQGVQIVSGYVHNYRLRGIVHDGWRVDIQVQTVLYTNDFCKR